MTDNFMFWMSFAFSLSVLANIVYYLITSSEKMNKDNAHEYLPLVQAMADGKTLQVQGGDGNWYNSKLINIPAHRYRIKPEPRTFKVYLIDTVDGESVLTTHPTMDHRWQQITVQEVLP